MQFIELWKSNKRGIGSYLLSLCIVLLTLIVSTAFADGLSIKFLGFSLQSIPENADLNIVLSLLLAPFAFALLALAVCVRFIHGRKFLTVLTGRDKFDWKRFFLAFCLWGLIMVGALYIGMAIGAPVTWNMNPDTIVLLALISLFILPLQTAAEEVLFRGFLFQAFSQFTGKAWFSIIITGILFGLLHWANPEVALIGDILMLFYIWTGLFLGIITHMDDGIELGLGYHTVNNVFAALVVTNEWQAFHTDAIYIDHSPPAFGWESWITLFVFQPLLVFVFSKVYGWKNWKEKLFG